MSTFTSFINQCEYSFLAALGGRSGEIRDLIGWEAFCLLFADLYTNNTDKGGRPNCDVVLMIRLLVLQQWYGLSDPELEHLVTDRISLRHFPDYPETIPDRSTIWLFRECLAQTGKDIVILEEFQRQLEVQGLAIKRDVIRDATFIAADSGYAPADTPPGDHAWTRWNRDRARVKTRSKSRFGHKLHILMDKDYPLSRRIETTTASLHAGRIDLSQKRETAYRDKGYFGMNPRASMGKIMHRAVCGHPLSIEEKQKAISRTRSLVKHLFAMIKRVFHTGHLMAIALAGIWVKNTFSCINFDLKQLLVLQRQPV